MSERARALEQAAQYRAIALDAIAAWQGQDDRADDKHRRGVSARTRAELRSRMLAVDAVLLAVDPPPSGAGPQAEELRAANVANLREMVGMAGRHRETLLAVRECILALARAAEATQHRQDRRRWAESLKEQHQRHVIESDALRKVLAAWEITANERSARLAAVEAERALQGGEILGQPAAVQRRTRRDPRVLRRVVRPEVLVGVEAHGVRPRRRSP